MAGVWRGTFTCVGWQVTLCDPIWQVTSRSSEMGFPGRAISAFTFLPLTLYWLVLGSVSEFSDENMMDPYNLAICFGPTLLRVPPHRDPVQHHPHIVELVRNILIHQEDIFLGDELLSDGSTYYERCFIEEEEG